MAAEQRLHIHDIAFRGISARREKVFFVQIGAADGRRFDPIHPFVKRFGWHGILVEPLPDIFEHLKSNYRGQPGLTFENVAIAEEDGTRQIIRVPLDQVGQAGVPGWAYGASTLAPEKTRFSAANSPPALHSTLTSAAVREKVRCITLDALLAKHDVERIDVLQIDTEGYDAIVLNQLDFDRFKPTLMNMEWQWLKDSEKGQVAGMLRQHGYALYQTGADLMAAKAPIESFMVSIVPPGPETVPSFFPGVTGLISHNEIQASDERPARTGPTYCEIARYRGSRSPLARRAETESLIRTVDGSKTYSQIADELEIDIGTLLRIGHELSAAYVLL